MPVRTYEPTLTYICEPQVNRADMEPVRGLRDLASGHLYDFDTVRDEKDNRHRRWLLIGSGHECHVQIHERTISENHCAFNWDPAESGGIVRDCSSKNGTFLNGRRITKTQVHNGDLITLGAKTFVAVGPGAADEQSILINAMSLREFLDKALAVYRSHRRAASALGLPASTLRSWLASERFKKVGDR